MQAASMLLAVGAMATAIQSCPQSACDSPPPPPPPPPPPVQAYPPPIPTEGPYPARMKATLPGVDTAPYSYYSGFLNAGTPPSGRGTMYFHYVCASMLHLLSIPSCLGTTAPASLHMLVVSVA